MGNGTEINMNHDSIEKTYLLYPAIIAILTTIAAYYGSYKLKHWEISKQNSVKRKDFIDKMLLALERLNNQLTKLFDDPSKHNYYSLQNIAATKPILRRMQAISDEKLSLFSDDNTLRGKVLDVLDSANTIIEELDSLENIPLNNFNDHQSVSKKTFTEFWDLKLRCLLEADIYLDDKNEPQYIGSSKANQEKLNQIKKLVQNLDYTIKNSQEQLNIITQTTQNRRSFLAVKILATQTKVKDLITDLNNKDSSR